MADIVVRRLNKEDRKIVAGEIEAEIRRRANRYGMNEDDIVSALLGSDVVTREFDTTGASADGTFAPGQDDNGGINTVYVSFEPTLSQSRSQVIAHELARYLMRDWIAAAVYSADTVVCPGADVDRLRYQIAEIVHERF